MKTFFYNQPLTYNGSQLRPRFGYMQWGISGDSVVAWVGPCDIPFEHMVDGEDVRAGARIAGSQMVHFIIEVFEINLFAAVALQRLFASIVGNYLTETFQQTIVREGDDLYWTNPAGAACESKATLEPGKLSISIATVSAISGLIHFAVNVSNLGTPVKTASLEDLMNRSEISPEVFAKEVMFRFQQEFESIKEATYKVRSV